MTSTEDEEKNEMKVKRFLTDLIFLHGTMMKAQDNHLHLPDCFSSDEILPLLGAENLNRVIDIMDDPIYNSSDSKLGYEVYNFHFNFGKIESAIELAKAGKSFPQVAQETSRAVILLRAELFHEAQEIGKRLEPGLLPAETIPSLIEKLIVYDEKAAKNLKLVIPQHMQYFLLIVERMILSFVGEYDLLLRQHRQLLENLGLKDSYRNDRYRSSW